MNKLFTKIAGLSLGLAMAIGVGVAVGSNSREATPVHAAAGDSPIVLDASSLSLSSTATSSTGAEKTYGGVKYIVASAKSQAVQSGATNNFTNNATILIGKSGAFIYNSDAIPGTITKIEVYANKGASAKVSIGVSTHATAAITSAPSTWGYTTTMSTLDSVYDASSAIVSGAKYFRYQVTNANNSQVQIRITYSASTKTLSSIAVKTAPTKTTGYYEGQCFDPTGLVITATYSDNSTEDISYAGHSSSFTFTPSITTALTTSDTSVTIAYGGKTTSQTISVVEDVLNSVSVSGTMTKTSYSTSDSWSSAGLTVTGSYAGKGNVDVTSSSTFKYYSNSAMTSEVATPSVLGVGNNQTLYIKATCSGVSNSTGYSQTVSVEAAPDVVLSTSNKPYTSTSSSNTGTQEVTLDDIQYNSYAAYIYNSYLSFNRSQSGAYLYNDTAYSKNIKKIVVDYNSGGSGYFTMYEGATANTETSVVSPSASGTGKITYTFSDTNQFFKFKLTTTGTYCNINSISIYLGSAHKSLSSIAVKTAPAKTAYKANEDFAPAGLVITATYSDSSTEDIAYSSNPTAFGFSPSKITAAGNVTITYGGKTCSQAVSLITVTNVTSVATAPSEVYKDGSIDPEDVVLNVVYSDSSVGTVTPDSVTCDTSSTGPATATATYNAATGTKSATFNVEVVREPSYDYVIDELTVSDTGISGTTYGSWSGVTKISGSVYAGNTNENNNGGIGMRQDTAKDPSGIIVTSSTGVATKVQVSWSTTTSRTIHIKGQNDAYSSIEHASNVTGTEVGTITYNSTEVDLSAEYSYICIYVTGGAVGLNSIKITWKIEGAADPLIENPTLSTGAEAEVNVGRNIPLTVTTNPVDSDEKLIVSSSNENYVTVSGAGRNYVIHGVAEGSATVTVAGAKGTYSSSVLVSVTPAVKTYDDKIMTPDDLGITSYDTSDTTYYFNNVPFTVKQVMKSGGFQFKKDDGYFYNTEAFYGSNNIKAVTLIMRSSNTNEPAVYESSTAGDQTTQVDPLTTFAAGGVNTYVFSGTTQFFRINASTVGATNIERIIVELEDSASTILSHARSAASTIINALKNTCGAGNSGYVTQSQWNSLNSSLTELGLTSDDKLFLKEATRIALENLSQGGATIENAMAHYDYCVTKFGYTPFDGITSAKPSGRVDLIQTVAKNSGTVITIVIISAVSLAAIGGYFLFRKKKEN